MARSRRWDRITGNFSAGVLSPAAQDDVGQEIWQQGAALIENFRIERDGGLTRRPAFQRHEHLNVLIPTHGVLAGKEWETDYNSLSSAQTEPARSDRLDDLLYAPVPGQGRKTGIAEIFRVFNVEAIDTSLDVIRISLGGAIPRSFTFHGVRLEGLPGLWSHTDSNGDFRLVFEVVVTTMEGDERRTSVPFGPGADELVFAPGKLAPGQIARDIVVPLDFGILEQDLVPLRSIAIRIKEESADLTPIRLAIEGLSCFSDNDTGDVVDLREASFRFDTPVRVIPWQIRDIPFFIVFGLDWLGWGQLQRLDSWRLTSRNAWHFTERQLREMTWAWYGGNILLFHHDFPMPIQVRLPREQTGDLFLEYLLIQNVPQLSDNDLERTLPDISLRGPQVEDAQVRTGGQAQPVTLADFEVESGDQQIRLSWTPNGGEAYRVYRLPTSQVMEGNSVQTGDSEETRTAEILISGLQNTVSYTFAIETRIGTTFSDLSVSKHAIPTARLTAPANVIITSPLDREVDGRFRIAWDAVANADRYQVQWATGTTPLSSRPLIEVEAPNTMLDTTTSIGDEVRVQVFAEAAPDAEGNLLYRPSAESDLVSERIRGHALAPPANLTATAGPADGVVNLRWDEVGQADSYEVRSRETGQGDDAATTEIVETNEHSFNGAATDTYEFEVRTRSNVRVSSGWTAPVSFTGEYVPPGPVPGIKARGGSNDTEVIVEWDAADRAQEYEIEHGVVLQPREPNRTTSMTTATFTGLTLGTVYQIRIRGIRTETDPGPWSLPLHYRVEADPIGTPPPPVATSGEVSGQTFLAFEDADNADRMEISVYDPTVIFNPTYQRAPSSPIRHDGDVGTTYFARVRGVKGTRRGVESIVTVFTAIAVIPIPVQPGVPTATPSGSRLGAIRLTWADVANATDFDIRYREEGRTEWIVRSNQRSGTEISGLVSGEAYEFQILAKNAQGSSDWSESTTAVASVQSDLIAPPARAIPPTLRPHDSISGRIIVTFTTPATATRVDLRHRIQGTADWTLLEGQISPTPLDLTAGRSFEVQVRGVNAGGEGAWSTSAFIIAPTFAAALAAPAGFLVTPSPTIQGQVRVVWSPVPGAVFYQLRYQIAGGSSLTIPASSPATIPNLTVGQTYTFEVRANDGTQAGAWSAPISLQVPNLGGGLGRPGNLRGTPSRTVSGQIELFWSPGANATSHEYQSKATTAPSFGPSIVVGGSSATFTGTPGTSYNFRVRAVRGTERSGWSNEITVRALSVNVAQIPATPSGLVATPSTSVNGQIDLAWNAAARAASYRYQWRTAGRGSYTRAASTTRRTASFSGTPDTRYDFQVIAINSAGESLPSGTVTATAPNLVAAPDRPTGLTSTPFPPTPGRVTLTWNAVSDATSYESRFKRNVDSAWTETQNPTTSPTRPFTGTGGVRYDYQVRAVGAGGRSAWSATHTFTAPEDRQLPAVPGGLTATVSVNASLEIGVEWNAASRATGFVLQWRRGTSGNWTDVVRTASERTYTLTATAAGVHQFRVKSTGANNTESAYSGIVSATAVVRLPAPTNFNIRVTADAANRNWRITWNNVSGAVSYDLRRRSVNQVGFFDIDNFTGQQTPFTNREVKAQELNRWQIRAVASNGTKGIWGPWSVWFAAEGNNLGGGTDSQGQEVDALSDALSDLTDALTANPDAIAGIGIGGVTVDNFVGGLAAGVAAGVFTTADIIDITNQLDDIASGSGTGGTNPFAGADPDAPAGPQ